MKKMKLMFQNNNSLVLFFCVLLLSLVIVSCSEDDEIIPKDEFFVGTYMARDLKIVEQSAQIDSVNFSILHGDVFSLTFFPVSSVDNNTSFCDVNGGISNFGSGSVQFAPTTIMYGNCDTLRIPSGTFTADFATHGDTIWLSKQVTHKPEPPEIEVLYDSLYQFKLVIEK